MNNFVLECDSVISELPLTYAALVDPAWCNLWAKNQATLSAYKHIISQIILNRVHEKNGPLSIMV